jgi:hypothetical protein
MQQDKEYVICKSCGYVMEKRHLKDQCPACGVPARMFEPYTEKVSAHRHFLLSLDLHPIIVHFPQAFTFTLLVMLVLLLFWENPSVREYLDATTRVLVLVLPFVIVLSFLAGLFDGNVRFRKLTTPILEKKIGFGTVFFILALVNLIIIRGYSLNSPNVLYGLIALTGLAFICSAILGIYGAHLINAKFPG